MTLFGFLLLILVLTNLYWGVSTKFSGAGWIYWVNIFVAVLLTLGYFFHFIPLT